MDNEVEFVSSEAFRMEMLELVDAFIKNQEEVAVVEGRRNNASDHKLFAYNETIETLKRLRGFIESWDLVIYPEEEV